MTALLPWLLIPGLLLLVGMGLGIALLTVRQTRRDLERRTGLITGGGRSAFLHGTAKPEELQDPDRGERFGNWLRQFYALGLSRTWGMRAAPLALLVTGAGAACLAWFALRSGLHLSVWASMLGGIGAFFFAPRVLLKREQSRADQKFLEAFPDTIDMAIRMLRAGVPISGAIRSILSDIMRKRRAMRLKARAVTGEVRMSAYVLGAIPFLVIGGLFVMTPDYLSPLISDHRGNVIVAMAIGSLLIGFGTIRRMMRSVTNV